MASKKEIILNRKVIGTLDVLAQNDKLYRRYMLFQGVYYIPDNIKIKMSYVRNVANLNNEEKVHDEYFIMKNIREFYETDNCKSSRDDIDISIDIINKGSYNLGYSINYIGNSIISICPYRYMYSNAANKKAYIYNNSTFLVTKFFEKYIKNRIKNNSYEKIDKWLEETELILGDICTKKDIINREYNNRYDNRLFTHMSIYWVRKANDHLKGCKPEIPDKPWNNSIDNYGIKEFLEEKDN